MTIRNENITAHITPADAGVDPFDIFHAYVESYTVYGKTAEGESTSYELHYDDELSLRRPEPEPIRPTHAGQFVRSLTGDRRVGITTGAPRSVKVSVQYVGEAYPVLELIEYLEVVELFI